MNFRNIAFTLMILTLWSGFWACKRKVDDPLEYDREVLLNDVLANYIQPAYSDLDAKTEVLHDAASDFVAAPGIPELDALRAALREAWLSWESCSPLGFGPAASLNLRAALNTFPADPSQVEANVAAGTWDLNSAANVDARGFPALDYLLHHADDAALLAEFNSATDSSNRRNLLTALTDDVRSLVSQAHDQWIPGGGSYAATFVASLGTDAGSSTAALVNQLNYDLEQLKNARLGIPLGKKTLGQTLPEKVECYYGGYSAELALRQFQGIRALYQGTAYQSTAQAYGLHAALVALDAQYNGGLLANAISNQAAAAEQALAQVNDPLSQAISNNNAAAANAAYDEVQKLVILLKTDMPSAMSILITYTDNDGD